MKPSRLAFCWSLIAGTLLAQQPAPPKPASTRHAIGAFGAYLELPAPWVPEPFGAKQGHQFSAHVANLIGADSQSYVQIDEVRALLETDGDAEALLDRRVDESKGAKTTVVRSPAWLHASRPFASKPGEEPWLMQCDVFARDGLAYLVQGWAPPGQRRGLTVRMEQVRDGLQFPPADGGWQRELATTQVVRAFGDLQIGFALRLGNWVAKDDADWLARYDTHDGLQQLMVFRSSGRKGSARMVGDEVEALRRWLGAFTIAQRGRVTVDGVDGTWLLGAGGGRVVKSMVLPGGEDQWFVVRYATHGGVDDARPEREALFASLRRERVPGSLELPKWRRVPEPADGRAARFLQAGTFLTALPGTYRHGVVRDGEGWLVHGSEWLAIDAAGDATEVAPGAIRSLVRSNGKIFGITSTDALCEVVGGEVRDLGIPAAAVASLGDALLLARTTRHAFLGVPSVAPSAQLVRRSVDGAETVVASFQGMPMAIAVDERAGEALVRVLPNDREGSRLLRIACANGAVQELGAWESVRGLVGAERGFLVTGQPEGETNGIWWLPGDGARECLVASTDVVGVALRGEQLFAHGLRDGEAALVAWPLAACRERGAHVQPFGPNALQAIATRWFEGLAAPDSAAAVLAARERAQGIARERHDRELPTAHADVQDLAQVALDGGDAAAIALLQVLAVASAIDAGAEWVASANASWDGWRPGREEPVDDPFACAVWVGGMVHRSFAYDEPWFAVPSAAIAHGRVWLIGADAAALRERAAACEPAGGRAALAALDVARLQAFARERPRNQVLREHVYDRLAQAGDAAALAAFAEPWVASEHAATADRVARAAGGGRVRRSGSETGRWQTAPRQTDLRTVCGSHRMGCAQRRRACGDWHRACVGPADSLPDPTEIRTMQKTSQTTLPQLRDPFQTLFGRLFGDALPEFYGAADAPAAPRTNISESDTAYELSFELPGLEEKDIHVDVQDNTLTLTAERKDQRESSGKRWHRVEHRYGQFTRTISLPMDAGRSGIEAVYKQGVLTITVPKAPESRPTKIAVRGG